MLLIAHMAAKEMPMLVILIFLIVANPIIDMIKVRIKNIWNMDSPINGKVIICVLDNTIVTKYILLITDFILFPH
jgi:hypothetical protein